MKISSRTIAVSVGWLLTVVVGFLSGRQTSPSGLSASESSGAERRIPGLEQGARAQGDRTLASSTRPDATDGSPRRTRERTIAALGESLRLSDRLARTRRILDLAETLSPGEFQEVVDAFRADGISRIRGTEYSLLLNAWVKVDPFAAAEYVETNDDSSGSRRTVIAAWAAIDPLGAEAWIADREDEGGTNDWVVGLVSGVASNDPLRALQLVEGMESAGTRSKSMQAVVPFVLQHGVGYATEWVSQIGSEDLQRGAARHLARELTRLDADQAGEWICSMASGPARRDAAEIVSDQWAREDLESARRWAEDLPEDSRAEAAGGVARHMTRQDPEGAATWLNSLGTNPALDGARRAFIQESSTRDPQTALENVYTLSQADEQEKMYQRVLKDWSVKNSKAVKTWVAYNAEVLPASIVKRYLPKPAKEPKKKELKSGKKQGVKPSKK